MLRNAALIPNSSRWINAVDHALSAILARGNTELGKVTLVLAPLDPIPSRTRCAHSRDVHPIMSDVRDLDFADQHLENVQVIGGIAIFGSLGGGVGVGHV